MAKKTLIVLACLALMTCVFIAITRPPNCSTSGPDVLIANPILLAGCSHH